MEAVADQASCESVSALSGAAGLLAAVPACGSVARWLHPVCDTASKQLTIIAQATRPVLLVIGFGSIQIDYNPFEFCRFRMVELRYCSMTNLRYIRSFLTSA